MSLEYCNRADAPYIRARRIWLSAQLQLLSGRRWAFAKGLIILATCSVHCQRLLMAGSGNPNCFVFGELGYETTRILLLHLGLYLSFQILI
jgi:hypothetical protein